MRDDRAGSRAASLKPPGQPQSSSSVDEMAMLVFKSCLGKLVWSRGFVCICCSKFQAKKNLGFFSYEVLIQVPV